MPLLLVFGVGGGTLRVNFGANFGVNVVLRVDFAVDLDLVDDLGVARVCVERRTAVISGWSTEEKTKQRERVGNC